MEETKSGKLSIVYDLSHCFPYPCRIPNCKFKKRNGRCSLNKITFVVVNGEVDHSKCLSKEEKC